MIGLMPLAAVLALNSPDVEIGEEPRTVAEVLDAKRADAGYPRLLAEIRARGITVPVWVLDGDLRDGHHRVAAAVDLGMQVVPVTDVPLQARCESCGLPAGP